jgi:hypothetical protein
MSLSDLLFIRRVYSSSDGSARIGCSFPRRWFAPFHAAYFRLKRFLCSRSC